MFANGESLLMIFVISDKEPLPWKLPPFLKNMHNQLLIINKVHIFLHVIAYWSCRSPDYTVSVYSKLVLKLVCPVAVRVNQEFYCHATFEEGSGIQKLQWTLDNSPQGSAITSLAGMYISPIRSFINLFIHLFTHSLISNIVLI